MSEKYYDAQKLSNIERQRQLRNELPYFCNEFFVGTENQTTPLTLLNYAYDLRIFFDFLVKIVIFFCQKPRAVFAKIKSP